MFCSRLHHWISPVHIMYWADWEPDKARCTVLHSTHLDNMVLGHFIEKYFIDRTFHRQDISQTGHFIDMTIHRQENSQRTFQRQEISQKTFHRQDISQTTNIFHRQDIAQIGHFIDKEYISQIGHYDVLSTTSLIFTSHIIHIFALS